MRAENDSRKRHGSGHTDTGVGPDARVPRRFRYGSDKRHHEERGDAEASRSMAARERPIVRGPGRSWQTQRYPRSDPRRGDLDDPYEARLCGDGRDQVACESSHARATWPSQEWERCEESPAVACQRQRHHDGAQPPVSSAVQRSHPAVVKLVYRGEQDRQLWRESRDGATRVSHWAPPGAVRSAAARPRDLL
jgi:hypothetical protein